MLGWTNNDHCVFYRAALARMFKGPISMSEDNRVIWKHMDILDYHFIDNGLYVQETYGYIRTLLHGGGKHKIDSIFPLKRCMLAGVEMRCPNNPRMYLNVHYEKQMDIMKLDKICKNNAWVDQKDM